MRISIELEDREDRKDPFNIMKSRKDKCNMIEM